jgi:hypothetical protein
MDKLKFNIAPKQEIIKDLESFLQDAPDEVSVNVIIKGSSAKKFLYVKTLLSSSFPELDEDDIVKFIIRSGVQRELEINSPQWKN